MTTTATTPVPTDEAAERSPRQLGRLGVAVATIGAFAFAIVLDDTQTTPHHATLTVSLLATVLGTILAVAGLIDYRNARRGRKYTARVEAKLDTLAKAVQANHDTLTGQLAAARTVDLHEVRQLVQQYTGALEEKVLMGQAMVARRFVDILKEAMELVSHTSTAAGVETITKAIEDLGTKMSIVIAWIEDRERRAAEQAAGVVDIEDVRLLKRLEERMRDEGNASEQ